MFLLRFLALKVTTTFGVGLQILIIKAILQVALLEEKVLCWHLEGV